MVFYFQLYGTLDAELMRWIFEEKSLKISLYVIQKLRRQNVLKIVKCILTLSDAQRGYSRIIL